MVSVLLWQGWGGSNYFSSLGLLKLYQHQHKHWDLTMSNRNSTFCVSSCSTHMNCIHILQKERKYHHRISLYTEEQVLPRIHSSNQTHGKTHQLFFSLFFVHDAFRGWRNEWKHCHPRGHGMWRGKILFHIFFFSFHFHLYHMRCVRWGDLGRIKWHWDKLSTNTNKWQVRRRYLTSEQCQYPFPNLSFRWIRVQYCTRNRL